MKINQAQKHTIYGDNPRTYAALYNLIPESVRAKITAREIGKIIDVMCAQRLHGDNAMRAEIGLPV